MAKESGPVCRMGATESIRHEHFNFPAQQFVALIAEQLFRLGVGEDYLALAIYHHHGVWRGLQQPSQLRVSLLALAHFLLQLLVGFAQGLFGLATRDHIKEQCYHGGAEYEKRYHAAENDEPVRLLIGSHACFFPLPQMLTLFSFHISDGRACAIDSLSQRVLYREQPFSEEPFDSGFISPPRIDLF